MIHSKGFVLALIVLLVTLYTHPILYSSIMSTCTMNADTTASALQSSATKKALARKKFQGAWEVIRSELLGHIEAEGMPKEAVEWYKRVSV